MDLQQVRRHSITIRDLLPLLLRVAHGSSARARTWHATSPTRPSTRPSHCVPTAVPARSSKQDALRRCAAGMVCTNKNFSTSCVRNAHCNTDNCTVVCRGGAYATGDNRNACERCPDGQQPNWNRSKCTNCSPRRGTGALASASTAGAADTPTQPASLAIMTSARPAATARLGRRGAPRPVRHARGASLTTTKTRPRPAFAAPPATPAASRPQTAR